MFLHTAYTSLSHLPITANPLSVQDHQVAVKQLRAAVREVDECAIDDFEREVMLLRRLRHRNIVHGRFE